MHHKQMTSMQWIRMDYEKLRVIKDRVAVSSEFREKNATFLSHIKRSLCWLVIMYPDMNFKNFKKP